MTSTEGIILRRIPYRSSGAVIDILTPTGKTGALLKGLDKKNSAVRQVETEPGTIADFILYPAKKPRFPFHSKRTGRGSGNIPGRTHSAWRGATDVHMRTDIACRTGQPGRPDAVRFPQAMYLFIALR